MKKPKKKTETKPYKIGVCVECKVRDGDSSKKKLYQCPYCGRWFCEKHIEPRIATTRGAIEQISDPVLRDKVLEEWRKPDGHPDTVWTKKYFEDLKKQEEEQRQKFWEAVEDLNEMKKEKEFEKLKKVAETSSPPRVVTETVKRNIKFSVPRVKLTKPMVILISLLVLFGLFYFFFQEHLLTLINSLVAIGTTYLVYKLFVKASKIRVDSDLRLFGLRLLSFVVIGIGGFLLWIALTTTVLAGVYTGNIGNASTVSIFFGILGFGLILLGAYLMFRFMFHSGIIVYVR